MFRDLSLGTGVGLGVLRCPHVPPCTVFPSVPGPLYGAVGLLGGPPVCPPVSPSVLGPLYGDRSWPGGLPVSPCDLEVPMCSSDPSMGMGGGLGVPHCSHVPSAVSRDPFCGDRGWPRGLPVSQDPSMGTQSVAWGSPKCPWGSHSVPMCPPPQGHPVSPSVLGPLYGDRGWRGPSVSLGIMQCPPVFPASVPQCPGTFLWGHRGWPGGPPLSLWPLPVSRDPCMVT